MTIKIRNANQDESDINHWWFQLVGEHSTDGSIRLARTEQALADGETPDDWLIANLAEAQALVDTGEIHEAVTNRWNFADMEQKAQNEIDYLNAVIPLIDTMTAAQVRDVVKRLAQENRQMIKAFRYLFNRLSD